ncbi:MAG: FAD-dependent monooxygenase [Hyphomicrobiaceae bacterium]
MADGQTPPVLIAGGGIGGLATALALARVGLASIVAERRSEWSEAGAGIQLSPNGVRALTHLGAADSLERAAGRPSEIVVRDAATARLLQRLPLGDWVADRHGAPYWQVHRRDLQSVLIAQATAHPLISLIRGFEAVSVVDDGRGVRLEARDGRSLGGRLLVGADGVFSTVRQQLFAPAPPRFSGRTAARTVVAAPASAEARAILTNTATGVWLAPGSHVVHYPVRAGTEIAVVVVRTEPWAAHGWSEPAAAAEIEAGLKQVAPAFAAALGTGHSWRRWALFETEPLAHWSTDRATLVGDAAHATLPFLAQGGSLALEDAVTLAACLARASESGAEPAALAAYEAARTGRCRRVVSAARRNGVIFHLSGPGAIARNLVMRTVPGARVMAGYDWVYGWRPPVEDVTRASPRSA